MLWDDIGSFEQLLDVMQPSDMLPARWPADRAGMEAERERLVPPPGVVASKDPMFRTSGMCCSMQPLATIRCRASSISTDSGCPGWLARAKRTDAEFAILILHLAPRSRAARNPVVRMSADCLAGEIGFELSVWFGAPCRGLSGAISVAEPAETGICR